MTSTQPLISVIVPYYEFPDLLRETIKSVQDQTYLNWEMVIADDCSPTNPSQDVVDSISDSRIKNVVAKQNGGTGSSRNLATSHSAGEYLLILDSDDLLAPTYMEAVLGKILEENADAGYSNVSRFGLVNDLIVPKTTIPEILAGGVPFNTLMMKRSLFDQAGGYTDLVFMDDTEFWLRALKTGSKFVHVEQPLYLYRMRPDSRSQVKNVRRRADFHRLQMLNLETMKEHLGEVVEIWQKNIEKYENSDYPKTDLQKEYEHLNSEFHALLERYEELEKKHSRNENVLSSFTALQKQIAYVFAKKLGLR